MSTLTCSVTSSDPCTCGVISRLTPVSTNWNCVLTSGLTPTVPTPGWKLPVAYGYFSPIFNDTFWPSETRTSGDSCILVRESDITACNVAPGRLVEKSLVPICPSCDSATKVELAAVLPVVVVVVVVVLVAPVPPVPLAPVVEEVIGLVGENWIGKLSPLVPLETSPAPIWWLMSLATSITMDRK